ncbi:MAG: lipoprotein-releasing system transmembrane subunit LolC [Pelagibacteraceae bacterium]|nr:lipoprotein-releasing system transmembrane subunit LolC [Pelagibacteraceae bacterium]|tara:strand:+ start:17737 stop:18987 length:1251 start_codon:yes stop_codon:yes gene_type:complete
MYSKSEFLLIKRFLFSKKTDGYISIFSWFSIIGISLGVATIIIVMSVMNGFRNELTKRMLGINSHLNVYSYNSNINSNDIKTLNASLNNELYNNVLYSIETNGLIVNENNSKGILIRAYEDIYKNVYLKNSLLKGKIKLLFSDVIIGDSLANYLNVKIGDKIKIAIPKSDSTIFGSIPRFKTLNIIGIFDLGLYEYDANLIYIHDDLARKLLLFENNTFNQIEYFVKYPNNIKILQKNINKIIQNNTSLNLYTLSWKDLNATLINALKVEKNVMFLILFLIVLVASINIISGLIIFVKEKNKDIGILKTIGLSNFSIAKIFFTIGTLIGFLGASIGVIIGIIFTLNIVYIQKILEELLNTKIFAEEIYFLSTLPSEIKIEEIAVVYITSIIISTLSALFPALRSSKVDPIITIRNE